MAKQAHNLLKSELDVLIPLEKNFQVARLQMIDFVLKKVVPRVADRSGKYRISFNLQKGQVILEDIAPRKIHLPPWKRRFYKH